LAVLPQGIAVIAVVGRFPLGARSHALPFSTIELRQPVDGGSEADDVI
jgi:hypothetical protein